MFSYAVSGLSSLVSRRSRLLRHRACALKRFRPPEASACGPEPSAESSGGRVGAQARGYVPRIGRDQRERRY